MGNEGNELGTKHVSHTVFLEILPIDNWLEYFIWKIEECRACGPTVAAGVLLLGNLRN